MQHRVSTAATLSAPGSLRRKASRAEASSTASAMILPLGLLATIADQFLGERDAGRGDIGEVRLHVADHRVEGAEDDARVGRLQDDWVARLDAEPVAELG